MDFSFTEDQRELRATVRAFLDRHATPGEVRAAALDGDGFARAAWERLTGEMELTALAIDEQLGGAGASFVEVAIALEQLGRHLLPTPYLSTVVAAHVARADRDASAELLRRVVAGGAVGLGIEGAEPPRARSDGETVLLDGAVEHVLDGPHCEALLLAVELDGEPVLASLDAGDGGVAIEALASLDHTRRQARLSLASAPAALLSAPDEGARDVARARDVYAVALAVESVGAAARCLEATVAYLKERVQFGRPIGSFQALKHRCADLAAELEAARSTAYCAAWTVDGAPDELPVLAPLARAVCGETLLHVAAEAIQLHGGIGFTWEHDTHLYFKRAKANELLAGGFGAHKRLAGARAGVLELRR